MTRRTTRRNRYRKEQELALKAREAAAKSRTDTLDMEGTGQVPEPWESRLERRAIAKSWVPAAQPQKLAKLLERQIDLAINPDTKPKEATAAARIVVQCVGQVMTQEARDSGLRGLDQMGGGPQEAPANGTATTILITLPNDERRTRLIALAERIGIGSLDADDPAGSTAGHDAGSAEVPD